VFELQWLPAAERSLASLESERGPALDAITRTLAKLEVDPFDPRLRTQQFRMDASGYVRATPARQGDWYVIWRFSEQREVEIVHLVEIRV
jgi:hypothetical protein